MREARLPRTSRGIIEEDEDGNSRLISPATPSIRYSKLTPGFRRSSNDDRSGTHRNQPSFSSYEGGDTVANSPEPQLSFVSTPGGPTTPTPTPVRPSSRKNSFTAISERITQSSIFTAFRTNKTKYQAKTADGQPLGDIPEREDSDILARSTDAEPLVNFWDAVNSGYTQRNRSSSDELWKSRSHVTKPLPPLPKVQSPAGRKAVDMDHTLMVPGGLDRSKQIQDAKEMWQAIVRSCERTNTALPQFQFLELIGKGSFGRVYKCFDKTRRTLVAVKILEIDSTDWTSDLNQRDETIKDIRKEVAILQQLKDSQGKNINMILDAFDLHSHLWIVTNYCTGGSIKTLMRANPTPGLEERFIIPLARETMIGVKSVHDIGIIHRDIKCTNIYVPEDGGIELGDFGVVGTMEGPRSKRTTIVGTPWYMPKEMHIAGMSVPTGYGTEVDIWAFGCTVYEMATGMVPNQKTHADDLADVLQQAPRLEGGDHSQGLRDFIAFCLNSDPVARPTADQVLQHPYIAGTSQNYPASDLVALIERYAVWEFKGGQRASLFFQGGATAPPIFGDDLERSDEDLDDWNFSTSDSFSKDFSRRYSHMLFGDEGPQFEAPAGSGLPPLKTKDLSVFERIQLEHQDKSATRGAESLDRLFNPEAAPYDMSTPVDFPTAEPLSDLPLRNISTGASTRESTVMIDLDADPTYPSGPNFNFDFEDVPTMKAKARPSISNDGDDDEDNEVDDYKYGEDDGTKRATREWTFPSMNTATKVAVQPKRATMDWTFSTAEEKEPDEDDNVMNLPPTGDGGAMAPGFRPQLKHTATVPLGQFGDFLHTTQPQHYLGAPTPSSPVRDSISSMIDLDLGLADPADIVRPMTASSTAESTNTEMTSGNPFDLEEDPEQNERDRDRFSYHKQWQSEGGVSNGNRGSLRNVQLHNRGTSLTGPEPGSDRGSQVPAAAEDVFGFDSSHESSDVLRDAMHMNVPHTAPLGPNNAWPNFDASDDSPASSGINIPQLGDADFPLSNGLQLTGPAIGPPRSAATSGTQARANGSRRAAANAQRDAFDFPAIFPPSQAALDENASTEEVADELSRMLDDLTDVFDVVSADLRDYLDREQGTSNLPANSNMSFDGFSMGEESDGGFDSTSSFGFRSGDEEGF